MNPLRFLLMGILAVAPVELRVANASPLGPAEFVPSPLATVPAKTPADNVWCDRVVYAPNDPVGQILVVSSKLRSAPVGSKLLVALEDGSGTVLDRREIQTTAKDQGYLVALPLDVSLLQPGAYTLRGTVSSEGNPMTTVLVPGTFSVRSERRETGTFPAEGVSLVTHPTGVPGASTAPVSFGAPLPYGAVHPEDQLVILEDGKPITTQTQSLALWGPGPDASVRWMGVSFLARYTDGRPRDYRLAKGEVPSSPAVRVVDSRDSISIDTGEIAFSLSKKAFRGPQNVRIKSGESLVPLADDPSAGGYVIDQNGQKYEASADTEVEVRVEETGPVRAAISFRGWYANPLRPAERLCRFIIRIYAYAGSARVDGTQRTIITYDTRRQKLADVGFSVPVAGENSMDRDAYRWFAGIDGRVLDGQIPGSGEVFFTQAKADAVWLNRLDGDPAGRRSDGWLAVRGPSATATGYLRDVWQKFPKEISSDGRVLTFHTWPKHSVPVFDEAEQITRENIHRNLFAHQGPLLDLQLPESYFNQLQAWQKAEPWDRENTAAIGFRSTADGVSMSIRFGVDYSAGQPDPAALAALAAVGMLAPSALTNPDWNAASGVIPFINAAGDPRWKAADESIESFVKGMKNLASAGNIYGMWIYGNTNNNWDTGLKVPFLHRLWQNSHYGHVSFPWKYYFRSANPEFLRFARAQTGSLMDVGIVYYSLPESSTDYAGKVVGSLYHAKGWLPWGVRLRTEFRTDSDLGLMQHWTNPKAFLERYLFEVDLEARDTFQVWYDALLARYQYRSRFGVGRELTQSISELVDIYQTLWDSRLVGYLRPMGDSALAVPFKSYVSQLGFAFFNRTWPIRYFEFARDPRVLERLREALPEEDFGPYGAASAALLFDQDRDLKRLPRLLARAENSGRSIYRNEEDPLDSFTENASAVNSRSVDEIPSLLYVLSRVDARALAAARVQGELLDAVYGARATPNKPQAGREAAVILAQNPDGRAFKVRFESRSGVDMLPALARIVSPDGKVLQNIPLHQADPGKKERILRYLGGDAKVVEVPAGAPGVYRIELFGYFPIYKATLTDLPEEVALIRPGTASVDGYVFAPGAKNLTFQFTAPAVKGPSKPYLAEVRNLATGQIQSSSLLFGSRRASWSAAVAGGPKGVRARIRGPLVSWEPADGPVYFSIKEESFEPVLAALPLQPAAVPIAPPDASPESGGSPSVNPEAE